MHDHDHDGHRDRLRNQFLKQGLDSLQDDQVLELLLFYAVPRRDTHPVARQLLARFGNLSAVLEASAADLMTVDGIGPTAAALLQLINPVSRRYLVSRAEQFQVVNSTQACAEYLIPFFHGAMEELVYVLCLDAKCKVLGCRLLQTGSINSVGFSMRRVVEIAIACSATSVVLAHNHTSGLALPSDVDIETTLLVRDTLEPLGILLADHIVIADGDYVSMADNGVLGNPGNLWPEHP